MITIVTQKNMVTIPAGVSKKLGIKPGYRLDWNAVEGKDEIIVKVIPDRGELARRMMGKGKHLTQGRDMVAELIAERELED